MKEIFKINFTRILFLLSAAVIVLFNQCKDPAGLKALVVSDGEQKVVEGLETILENTGLFDADLNKRSELDFTGYDVVLVQLSKDVWSEKTKENFVVYINSGGGAVLVGNTVNAFSDWREFMDISGIESSKPAKKSSSAFEYQLANSKKEHPILEGLHQKWIHSKDYLMFNKSDIGGSLEVLATAWADTLQGGDGMHVPVLAAHNLGEGRVFYTSLGTSATDEDLSPIQCVGFITTLQRGAEWVATGVVSQEVTIDFPNSASTHLWDDFEPLELDELLTKASVYEVGKSKKYLDDFTMRIRMSDGKHDTYAKYEDVIIDFLASDATVDSKRYMCRELSWIGSEKSISVLEKLVNDKDLSESASYALQRLRM